MARRFTPFRDPVTLELDGNPVEAERGEPLVHALIGHGLRVFGRSPKLRRPRGPWCLRGACDGCLARVDGIPDVMTCMVAVRGGEKVESQSASHTEPAMQTVSEWLFPEGFDHHRMLAAVPGGAKLVLQLARRVAGIGTLPARMLADAPTSVSRPDVLIVGGGPSGRTVASLLCKEGLDVVLADDGPVPGGSLLGLGFEARDAFLSHRPCPDGVLLRGTVAGLFDGQALLVQEDRSSMILPRAIVIACGAHDAAPAIPGNDLPGVMSDRAVARLAACGIAPGDRVVIAGDSPFCDAAAQALQGRCEMVRVANKNVAALEGGARLRRVVLADGSKLDADVIALQPPRAPSYELAMQAGARVEQEPGRGWVPQAGEDGRIGAQTWCAGECAGSPFDLELLQRQAEAVARSVRLTLP